MVAPVVNSADMRRICQAARQTEINLTRGALNVTVLNSWANGSRMGSMSSEWNACETCSALLLMPAAFEARLAEPVKSGQPAGEHNVLRSIKSGDLELTLRAGKPGFDAIW